jgi:hypothetical protein
MTARDRLVAFGVIVVAAVAVGALSIVNAVRRSHAAPAPTAAVSFSPPPAGRPFLLFRSTLADATYGTVAYAEPDRLDVRHPVPGLQCRRVNMAAGRGVCLAVRGGTAFVARVFDAGFNVTAELPLAGVPSRVQVAPDGSLAATTVFVSGHSYADASFSTRTSILDVAAGRWLVEDMETFQVLRDGRIISAPDFNFWGVTFLRDARTFYATLATAGKTYLVRGNVDDRALEVIAPDVECPSISPDNRAIAFKQLRPGSGPAHWEVWLLDLGTMARRSLGDANPVDDQVQWLDDQRLAYARPTAGDPSSTDLWTVRRDGGAAPSLYLARAGSLASVPSSAAVVAARH